MEKLYGWFAPGAYADEHVAHYTYGGLVQIFTDRGFTLEASRYILQGELILAFRKGGRATGARTQAASTTARQNAVRAGSRTESQCS
jgi:hypothetical protein